jgi:hypothetical protein
LPWADFPYPKKSKLCNLSELKTIISVSPESSPVPYLDDGSCAAAGLFPAGSVPRTALDYLRVTPYTGVTALTGVTPVKAVMPNDPPPWWTVYQQGQRCIQVGVFEKMTHRDLWAVMRLAKERQDGKHNQNPGRFSGKLAEEERQRICLLS